jgi:hypothetical protein
MISAWSTAVRRAVAILIALFSYAMFIPVGGVFYIFLLIRATTALSVALFLAAMRMSGTVSSETSLLLHQTISFFPQGISIIWNIASKIWHGTVESDETGLDSTYLITHVILALITVIAIYAIVTTETVRARIGELWQAYPTVLVLMATVGLLVLSFCVGFLVLRLQERARRYSLPNQHSSWR